MAVGMIRRKKLARFAGTKGMPELEEKAVRRVKTQAGVDRFKQPMGSIIIGGGAGNVLKNLKVSDSDYDGFDAVESTGSRNKGTFYVGKYEGDSTFSVTDSNDEILHEAPSQEAAFKWLNTHANGSDTPAEKPKPGSGAGSGSSVNTPEPKGPRGTASKTYDDAYQKYIERASELDDAAARGGKPYTARMAEDSKIKEYRAIMDEELAAGGRKVPKGRAAYPDSTYTPTAGGSGSPKVGGGKLGGGKLGGGKISNPGNANDDPEKWIADVAKESGVSDKGQKVIRNVLGGGALNLDGRMHARLNSSETYGIFAHLPREERKKIMDTIRTNAAKGGSGYGTGGAKPLNTDVLKRIRSMMTELIKTDKIWAAEEERNNSKGDDIMASLAYKAVPISGVSEVDGDEPGVVTAIVSVTGIKDNVNDIILPGAFIKSLAARNPKGVWHHNITESVSRTEAVEELAPGHKSLPETLPNGQPWPSEAGGLLVKTRFNLNTTRGRDAYEDVKFFGADQEWSIGYNVPMGGATIDKKTGTRMIHHLDLFEYSPVLFGAMPNARTVSVKSAQLGWKAIDNPEMSMEIKDLLSQLADEQNALHMKSASKDDDNDDDDDDSDDEEMTDKNGKPLPDFIAKKIKKGKKGEKKSDELDDDEDEDDDETSEEKSFNVALDSKSVGYIEDAIASLTALRDHVVDQHKAAATDDDDDDWDDNDDTEEKGDSALAGLLSDAGLDGDAEGFDKAIADKDSDAAEEIGSSILDAVEAATDKGDDKAALKSITAYIAKAFQKIDAEEPAEDEAEKPTEKKDGYIQLDQKSFNDFQALLTD